MADFEKGDFDVHYVQDKYAKIHGVFGTGAVRPKDEAAEKRRRRNREHGIPQDAAEVKDNFPKLAKVTEETNRQLIESKSPYRFCIFRKNNQVWIDLVVLDENGDIIDTVKRNITHEDFNRVLKDVRLTEGLFYDETF